MEKLDKHKDTIHNFCLKLFLYILFLIIIMPSCSSEKQKEMKPTPSVTSASSYKIEIQPLEATKDSTFYILSKGLDLSNTKIEWLVNGIPVESRSGLQFRSTDIKKGDKVQVRIILNNNEILSNEIVIRNTPPVITKAKILPAVSKAGDILKIDTIVNDLDGDEISLSYEWYKNGEPSGTGESFEGPFKRGDKISVRLTPYDREDYGRPVTISTEIFNSPPRILNEGIEKFHNNIYSYQIKASDPDGDALTYSLMQAPENMTIDKTGLIIWKVDDKIAGRYPVTVQITDGHGGEIQYNFNVVIRVY